ncbi:MAG TPA: hypothetical protein VLZ74_12460 [Methylocella sp.]|nr:hypothetical protein [Methylocella sp.]
MTALLAFWLCGFCLGTIYYSLPPPGTRPDIYGVALWVLSSSALVGSAIVLLVSLVPPVGIHPPNYW